MIALASSSTKSCSASGVRRKSEQTGGDGVIGVASSGETGRVVGAASGTLLKRTLTPHPFAENYLERCAVWWGQGRLGGRSGFRRPRCRDLVSHGDCVSA